MSTSAPQPLLAEVPGKIEAESDSLDQPLLTISCELQIAAPTIEPIDESHDQSMGISMNKKRTFFNSEAQPTSKHITSSPRPWSIVASLLQALTISAASTIIFASYSSVAIAQDELTELQLKGKALYLESCADCHGEAGEGVGGAYESALVGDSSIGELTKVIDETMPEGFPEDCVGEDAAAIADYIHYAFYSEAARIRNRPPRLSLTRLTASQLRQSYADLYSHFAGSIGNRDERGIRGEYFDGKQQKKENRKIERVDPVIDFDFGHDGPGEGINGKEFVVQWVGGLLVEETGRYELIVRSSCSFVMDFGAHGRELINNNVQSGDKTEFRRTLTLVRGQVYPFRINLRQRERSTEQPPANISVSWVPPHGTEEIIPERNLVPGWLPATFAMQTALPPDDRSYGYERGIAVNRPWDESTTAAAIEFAEIAFEELWPRFEKDYKEKDASSRDKMKAFLKELVEVAFRGPLSDREHQLYIDQQLDAAEDDREAMTRCLLIALKSPRFLYPGLDLQSSPSKQTANRLALTLFDSLPSDKWLLQLAEEGKLEDEQQVRNAAWRMVNDFRTRGKTRDLLYSWLNMGHIGEITKDDEQFSGFDKELVADLRSSLNAFIDDVVWSEASDYRQFFLADWAYTSDRIAEFYGDQWKPGDDANPHGLTKITSDSGDRFGLLTHPFLLSGLAYHDATSPIHRGVFLIRYMLGRTIRPPNAAFTPLSPDLHPDLTTRERVVKQTSPESCQVCHVKINGLGFTLENYDAVGRFREKERGKPINSSGYYVDRSDEKVEVSGAGELAKYLANSRDSARSFVDRSFQHFVKQPIAAYGPNRIEELTDKFIASNYNVRGLLVEIAVIAAMNDESFVTTATQQGQ